MQATMAVRDAGAEARFLDIHYEDTVADAFAVIDRVYAFAGLPLTAPARQAMHDWQEDNRREGRPAHQYSLAQFGFTEAGIRADFAEYRERFILPRAGRPAAP